MQEREVLREVIMLSRKKRKYKDKREDFGSKRISLGGIMKSATRSG